MLNLEVLSSSSKGNCYLIRTKNEVLILEAGLHYSKIVQALNFNLVNVSGCLISHEHADHSFSAGRLAKSGIDIYSSAGTFEALNKSGHRFNVLVQGKEHKIGEFTVLPFDVRHDCREPFGYLIFHKEIGKILFATDTFYIKYKFKGLNYIMIECNYSYEILNSKIDNGELNPAMKRRLLTSHFSLENVIKFLQSNDLKSCIEIILIHMSDNNSSNEFKFEVQKKTGVPVKLC